MEKHRKKGQNGKDSNRRPESRKGNWERGWSFIKPRKKVKDESRLVSDPHRVHGAKEE